MPSAKLLWAGIVLAAGGVAVYLSLYRLAAMPTRLRLALGTLRSLVVLIAAVVVLEPRWAVQREKQVMTPLLVVFDCSDSMDLPDMPGHATRREALNKQVLAPRRLLDTLASMWPVEAYRFDRMLLPLARRVLPPGGNITDLGTALQQLHVEAARSKAAAIVFFGDGVDTEGLTPAYAARLARGLPPILAVPMGGREQMPNRVVVGLRCPRSVRAGESVALTATVASPSEPNRRIKAEWTTSDGLTRPVTASLGPDGAGKVELPYTPTVPGRQRVSVHIDRLAGEISTEDNVGAATVDVLPAKPRLVYLDGSPRPELAALRRLVQGLKDVKVTVGVRKAPGMWWEELPARRVVSDAAAVDGFGSATAYVLGNVPREATSPQTWAVISRRIQRGEASLLALGGPAAVSLPDEIQQLLPHQIASYQSKALFVSRANLDSALELEPMVYEDLPALTGANNLTAVRQGARTVLRATDGTPLLCVREDGSVRSAVVATDSTYRWLLSSGASERSQAAYRDLWLKVLAWVLAPRPARAVTLFADRLTALAGDPIMVTAEVRAGVDAVRLQIVRDRRVVSTLTMARAARERFEARIPPLQAGNYFVRAEARSKSVKAGEDQLLVEVAATSREWRWTEPNRAMLQAIADATGGSLVEWDYVGSLMQKLPRETERVVETRQLEPSRGVPAALAVIGLLCADWVLRRRWGMI